MDLIVTIIGGFLIGLAWSGITVLIFGDAFHTSILVVILFNIGVYLGSPSALWSIKKIKNIRIPYWRLVLYSLPGPLIAGLLLLILQNIHLLNNLTVVLILAVPGLYTYIIQKSSKRLNIS